MKDYYYILGIDEKADEMSIRGAYKKLTLKLHPDRNGGDPFFENYFKQIQEAYQVLSVPSLRETYDYKRRLGAKAGDTEGNRNLDKPLIHRFTASKNSLAEGELVTLSWEVANADDVYIDVIGRVEPEGTKTIRLPQLALRERMPIVLSARNIYLEDEEPLERTVWILNKNHKGGPALAQEAESVSEQEPTKRKKKAKKAPLQLGAASKITAPSQEEDEETEEAGSSLRLTTGRKDIYVYSILFLLLGFIALLILLIYNLYLKN